MKRDKLVTLQWSQ